ncbi:hypothetical protein [Amycolatopsis sp. NPDC004625]|uniref:hypothetical protein n=1 Tax=Amycolatopsis sp. NPDC004625 TaxID=3154670 RepID=UPI0033B4B9AE
MTEPALGAPEAPVFVLATRPLRPEVALTETSRFSDVVWELGPAVLQRHARHSRLDFATVPAAYRDTAKQLSHAMLSGPLPPDETRLAISTVHGIFVRVARFLTWLDAQHTVRSAPIRLAEVTTDVLAAFGQHLDDSIATPTGRALVLSAVRWLWRLRHALTDALPLDPSEVATWSIAHSARGENRTDRIPEEVHGPLIGWALRFVRDFAPDIIAAAAALGEYRRPHRTNRQGDNRGVGARIQQVLDRYVAAGDPLPGHEHGPNLKFLAWQAGCQTAALYRGTRPAAVRAAAAIVGVAEHTYLPIAVRGRLDGRLWLPGIPIMHPLYGAAALERLLRAACYITLAFFSGMRDSEIKHLRRGCVRAARAQDGTPYRWSVHSLAFKGEHDPHGTRATWTIGEPAAAAVAVLEQLHPGPPDALLFATDTAPTGTDLAVLGSDATNQQLRDFTTWINRFCQARGRVDRVPSVGGRPWLLRTSQFRRTLAWFIARRPGGSIAGAIQYRHLSIHMFEGYAGTSDSGFRAEVEAEQALARGEALLALATDHDHPGLTGPSAAEAARRLGTFAAAFAGQVVTDPARLRRLLHRADPAIYPGEYVTCVFSPDTALCVPNRARVTAPELSSCQPLDCPNVALTAANADALARETRHLNSELASAHALPPLLGRRLAERRDRITAYLTRHTPEKP